MRGGGLRAGARGLRRVRFLGGFTGAWLVAEPGGALYVSKNGADHVREEVRADEVYRVLGVPVPDGGLSEEGGRPAKVSAFVEGTSLQELMLGGYRQAAWHVAYELRKGFAADALLANWDVVGVAFGNPILGEDGAVYRVDNGASLRRRARGGTKPAGAFSGAVRELYTLRDPRVNRSAAWVFSGLPEREIAPGPGHGRTQAERGPGRAARGAEGHGGRPHSVHGGVGRREYREEERLKKSKEERRNARQRRRKEQGARRAERRAASSGQPGPRPVAYVRLGELPEGGRSEYMGVMREEVQEMPKHWQGFEEGVSCFEARRDPDGSFDGSLRVLARRGPGSGRRALRRIFLELVIAGRPAYEVTGELVGRGLMGEPLLRGCRAEEIPLTTAVMLDPPKDKPFLFVERWNLWRYLDGTREGHRTAANGPNFLEAFAPPGERETLRAQNERKWREIRAEKGAG